jgi:hypothetical protein
MGSPLSNRLTIKPETQLRPSARLVRGVDVDRDGNRRLACKQDRWLKADKLPIRQRGIG